MIIYIRRFLITILVAWYMIPIIWTFMFLLALLLFGDYDESVAFCIYATKMILLID